MNCSICRAPGICICSGPQWTATEHRALAPAPRPLIGLCAPMPDQRQPLVVSPATPVAAGASRPPASNVASANGLPDRGLSSRFADFHGFSDGLHVEKIDGYRWPGVVVATFYTLDGKPRIVVECTVPEVKGALHIYNPSQLQARKPKKAPTNVSEPDRSYGNLRGRLWAWLHRKR